MSTRWQSILTAALRTRPHAAPAALWVPGAAAALAGATALAVSPSDSSSAGGRPQAGDPRLGLSAPASFLQRALGPILSPRPVLCDATSFKTRTVGNYENRIRRHANPEKVFEYFASVQSPGGEYFMTPHDFVRAVTPYNPYLDMEVGSKNAKFHDKKRRSPSALDASSEQREEYTAFIKHIVADDTVTSQEVQQLLALRKRLRIDSNTHLQCVHEAGLTASQFASMVESKGGPAASPFYLLIDSNGDGLIDYSEYAFFVTVLSVPWEQFDIAFRLFDTNGDGGIDRHEFGQLMELMRAQSNQGRHLRDGKGLIAKAPSSGEFPQFFGEAGDKSLTLGQFREFVVKLQGAIHEHEFQSWDRDNNGTLSATEFGMSLVAYAAGDTSKYVERAQALKGVTGRISQAEFMAFQVFLAHLDKVEIALHMASARNDGAVDQASFQRAAAAALKAPTLAARARGEPAEDQVLLSPLQVEILFIMFDEDGDGRLATDECVEVLRNRATRALDKRRDLGIVDMFGTMAKCFKIEWGSG